MKKKRRVIDAEVKKALRRLPLILASGSPRRRRLLREWGWKYVAQDSGAVEPSPRGPVDPRRWVLTMAQLKAGRVARRIKRGLVLGVDTIVYRKGRVIGKPSSRREAGDILNELSGKWHTVYSGLVLHGRPGRRVWKTVCRTRVKVRSLSANEITYWSNHNHDKAGAYAAQSRRACFVEKFVGDYDNVVGLPRKGVIKLIEQARRAGFFRPVVR